MRNGGTVFYKKCRSKYLSRAETSIKTKTLKEYES